MREHSSETAEMKPPRPSRAVRRWTAGALLLCMAPALSACGGGINFRKELGLVGAGPDEFAITTNEELVMPDSLPSTAAELPTPQPGARSRVGPRPFEQARAALNVGSLESAEASSGERALVSGLQTDPAIRSTLEEEAEAGLIDSRLLDGVFGPEPELRDALDPSEEARRLAEEARAGKNPDLEIPEDPTEE